LIELIGIENVPKVFGGECDCEAKGCFARDPPYMHENGVDDVTVANVDINKEEKGEKGEHGGEANGKADADGKTDADADVAAK